MGIAVVVPSISFASKNLGRVMATGGALESLAIGGPDYVNDMTNKAKFYAYFTPYDTNERDVVWSIESGSSYASIDGNTGELSVLPGASFSPVTIKVTSVGDSSIYATKDITVNFSYLMEYVASKAIEGVPYVTTINPASSYNYEMVFMLEDSVVQDMFGTRVNGTTNVLRFFGENSTQKFRIVKGTGSTVTFDPDHLIQLGKKYRIVITNNSSNGVKLYEVNGSVETLIAEGGNMSGTVSSTVPVTLCALNNNGTPISTKYAKLIIYGYRVFTNNGNVLVLKPYYDSENSRPAFFDELTDTVYPYHSTGTATLFYKRVDGTEQSVSINS